MNEIEQKIIQRLEILKKSLEIWPYHNSIYEEIQFLSGLLIQIQKLKSDKNAN